VTKEILESSCLLPMGGAASKEEEEEEEEEEEHFFFNRAPRPRQVLAQEPSEAGADSNEESADEAPTDESGKAKPSESVRQRKTASSTEAAQSTKKCPPEQKEAESKSVPEGSPDIPSEPEIPCTGPAWKALIILFLSVGIGIGLATWLVPCETSFKAMKDVRYAKAEAGDEFEFTDTDGDVIMLKKDKTSKFSYRIDQYVNGMLEERDLKIFDVDPESRTYRDTHGDGDFREGEDVEKIVRLRDAMFGIKELAFTDTDGDHVKLKRERNCASTKQTHCVNHYLNGSMLARDLKYFHIIQENYTYIAEESYGYFRADADLVELIRLRNEVFGNVSAEEPKRDWSAWLQETTLADGTFNGHVTGHWYVNHGPISLGTVALTVGVAAQAEKSEKSTIGRPPPSNKVYWHRYLGFLGHWLPLPYLPQPGHEANTFGAGVCLLGHCVCFPDKKSKEESSETGKKKRAKKRGCLRFTGGFAAPLNLMRTVNIVFVALWRVPQYREKLANHAMISLASVKSCRFWVFLLSPFCQISFVDVMITWFFTANAVEIFERTAVSFYVFFFIYFGGCWLAWFVRIVVYHILLKGDPRSKNHLEWGAAGGLAAQLAFSARAFPEDGPPSDAYVFVLPFQLKALMYLFIHAALVTYTARRPDYKGNGLAVLVSWAFGFLLYNAWKRHI